MYMYIHAHVLCQGSGLAEWFVLCRERAGRGEDKEREIGGRCYSG